MLVRHDFTMVCDEFTIISNEITQLFNTPPAFVEKTNFVNLIILLILEKQEL